MKRTFLCLVLAALVSAAAASQVANPRTEALIARGKSLELATPYVPPPGDALEHHTAGFAKIMCSAVFMTGLDPDFAAENVGYFISPYAERAKVGKPEVDRAAKMVHITLPNGVRRSAKYVGDQGCVILPAGETSVKFKPVEVKRRLPDASKQAWPDGRSASERPAARRHRCRESEAGRGCGI